MVNIISSLAQAKTGLQQYKLELFLLWVNSFVNDNASRLACFEYSEIMETPI